MRALLIVLFAVCCFEVARGEEIDHWDGSTIDRQYVLYATGLWCATIADVETTMRALDNGAREGNPLLGEDPSRAKLYAITGGINAAMMYFSWRLKRQGKRFWMMPMVVPMGTHGVAAGFNLRF